MRKSESTVATPSAAMPAAEPTAAAPVKADRPLRRASSSPSRTESIEAKKPSNATQTIEVSLWEPALRNRVKTVLNPGSKLDVAAADFNSSEQFITVAHAARNTNLPFMVLKDRVVNQGKSLDQAIHEFKPELDAKAEVTRARAAARSDLQIAS
jgi:hypothetical protein